MTTPPTRQMDNEAYSAKTLTISQTAALLDLPPLLVTRFVRSGMLAASEVRPGEHHIPLLALARFLAEHPWLAAGTTRGPSQ